MRCEAGAVAPRLFDLMNPEPAPAEFRRALGMARATAHADADHEGWSTAALVFLTRYAAHHATFTGFEVTAAARAENAVPEASGKAWGSVFVVAARQGIVRKTGEYVTDPNRHNNPAPRWASLVFVGEA